jgi:hypothetical protein
MRHEDAWHRLPDLLEDRDDSTLLGHVRDCADCQRQLFLLGRVDRLLRDEGSRRRPPRQVRAVAAIAAFAAAVAVAATFLLAFVLPSGSRTHVFTLRTAAGRSVGHAAILHADRRNDALSLDARRIPLNPRHMFVLWAGDGRVSMRVGEFMVDNTGGCKVRLNLPATRSWTRFWISQPDSAKAVVAST